PTARFYYRTPRPPRRTPFPYTTLFRSRTVAEKERATLLAQAREQYEQLLDRARKEIEGEKEKAILELRREAVDLSIAAASTGPPDRKSTRLNSSHVSNSYAVFCLKKKK